MLLLLSSLSTMRTKLSNTNIFSSIHLKNLCTLFQLFSTTHFSDKIASTFDFPEKSPLQKLNPLNPLRFLVLTLTNTEKEELTPSNPNNHTNTPPTTMQNPAMTMTSKKTKTTIMTRFLIRK